MKNWLAAILAGFAILTSPLAANAMPEEEGEAPRVLAVIVGNTNYDPSATEVIRWVPLIGAYNDAVLIADTLLKEGVPRENITLITEKPKDDGGLPIRDTDLVPDGIGTRAAILGALKRIVETTRAGDEVLISFSGHGYHQKEMIEGNEPDGADEIFIPLDIRDPEPGDPDKRLPQAITDDEIGAVIDAIRAKGGNVTYIADFCHSGDTMRSGGKGSGLPPPGILVQKKFADIGNGDFVKDLAVEVSKGKPGWGKFVAMMAAPSDVVAKQRLAPGFYPREARAPHGALTAYSFANLGNPAVVTYRDLATRVGSNIAEYETTVAGKYDPAPLPLFDGDLDRPILGGLLKSAGEARDSWIVLKPRITTRPKAAIDRLEMSAGTFNGVTPGTIIKLSSVRQGGEEVVLLYGEVESATAFTAQLVPASFEDIGADAWQDLKDADGKRFAREARLIAMIAQRPIDVSYRVSKPTLPANPTPAQSAVLGWIDSLSPEAIRRVGVTFVESSNDADLELKFVDGKLELSETGKRTSDFGAMDIEALHAIDGDQEVGTELSFALKRAARFSKIRRLLASDDAIGTGSDNPAEKIAVRFHLTRKDWLLKPDGDCRTLTRDDIPRGILPEDIPADSRPLGESGFTAEGGRIFKKCDMLTVEIENISPDEVYVNPIFLTSSGAIYWLPTLKGGSDTRYPAGRKGTFHWVFGKEMDLQQLQDELFILVSDRNSGTAVVYNQIQQKPVLVPASENDKTKRSDTGATTLRSGKSGGTTLDSVLNSVLGGANRSGTSNKAANTGVVRFEFTVPPSDRGGS